MPPPRGILQGLYLPIFVPTILVTVMLHIVIYLLRITTSYRALEVGLSPAAIGVLTGVFGLGPVLLAVAIGRMNDRRGEAMSSLAGSLAALAAGVGFLVLPASFGTLLLLSAVLGIAQMLQVSALQLTVTRCATDGNHDRPIAYFMLAVTLGQVVGPLLVGIGTPVGQLYPGDELVWYALVPGLLMLGGSVALKLVLPSGVRSPDERSVSMRALLGTPGLVLIVLTASLTVTANDLLMVYYPVIAALQQIDASTVGWLLLMRACGAMISRLFYVQLVQMVGRQQLLVASMLVSGLALSALLLELPIWAVALVMLVAGGGLGLGLAAGLTLTILTAPPSARATALSLRLTASRLGQFSIPVAASGLAAVAGAGAIFGTIGLFLVGAAFITKYKLKV